MPDFSTPERSAEEAAAPGSAQRLIAGAVALGFVLVVSTVATLKLTVPPKPLGADGPSDRFSAARALACNEEFAQHPHPLGSPENVRVKRYLAGALEEAGYEVFVQDQPLFQGSTISRARNVYARLEGSDSTGAVLLCAHYDSVPYGPGAADDGSGVAAIIEIARILREGPQPKNDIIFLLTDGEENGLLGPRTFLEHNPWRDDLKLVVNFEARGHYGPTMMYLTWPGNRYTMGHFIEGASHPVTSSVMFDFAGSLPTSSDYYVFKERGYPGFDLAFVGGLKYYHTPNDSPEKMSLRSLQHHGEYGLSLARHFGGVDLGPILDEPDDRVVYFNAFGHHMVMYGAGWIWPLSLLALFTALLALGVGIRRRRITVGGTAGGIAVFLVPLFLLPVLSAAPVVAGVYRFGPYALYNQHWYFAGFLLLAVAVFFGVYAVASRKMRPETLAAGALTALLPLLVVQTAFLPMGSFFLAWPVLGAAVGLLVLFLLPESEGPWLRLVAGCLGATPALVIMTPFLPMLIETFTFLTGPLMLIPAGAMLGLAAMLLALAGQAPRIGFGVPLAALVLALFAFAVAVLDTRFTPDRPKMNYLLYGADYSRGEAIYATLDRELDSWTRQFFSEEDPWGDIRHYAPGYGRALRIADAPLADIDLAVAEVREDVVVDGVRRIELHIHTGYETAEFELWAGAEVAVENVTFNGRAWNNGPRGDEASWHGRVRGRFDEGVTLVFETPDTETPFPLTIVERSYGVPAVEGIEPRPDWMIPMSNTMPVAWDFSLGNILSGNPVEMLSFEPGSRSHHIYARQDWAFAVPSVPAPASDDGDGDGGE